MNSARAYCQVLRQWKINCFH